MRGGSVTVFSRRWLGLANLYHVRIDGQEIGRIGRRKSVTAQQAPGRHEITVLFGDRVSRPLEVDLGEADDAQIELTFSWRGLAKGPVFSANVREGAILRRVDRG